MSAQRKQKLSSGVAKLNFLPIIVNI